jgi:hypothetical protein
LMLYLALFLVFGGILALVVIFRRHTNASASAPSPSAAAMPPLT